MIVGVDFDNTLVSYDRVFHSAAGERGITLGAVSPKTELRNQLRSRPDGEIEWRRLQALVYGPRMGEAELIAGVTGFFSLCRERGIATYIVSHKTESSAYAEAPVNLRDAALQWMEAQGFFETHGIALTRGDVFFAASRSEKLQRIATLGCTHFVDDLEEVLLDAQFPRSTERLMFAPGGRPEGLPTMVRSFASWPAISEHLFGVMR